MHRYLRSLAAPIAGLVLGAAAVSCTSNNSKTAENDLVTVQPADLEVVINEAGVLAATRVIPIIAPFSGKVITLPETGSAVKQGDIVLALENEEDVTELKNRLNELKTVKSDLEGSIESLQIALRSNMLDVDLAESQLSVQRARLEDVSTRLAETEVLLKKNVVPAEDLRTAQSQVANNELSTLSRDLDLRGQVVDKQSTEAGQYIQIQRTELRGQQARRRLNETQERIEQSTIKAPVDGMFLRKARWQWSQQAMVETRLGDTVRSGMVVGEIPDLSSMIIQSQIPESDLHRVSVGTPVEMVFDAYNGLVQTGKIAEIGKVAIEREASAAGALVQTSGYSGQKVFEITIHFDSPDPRLKPGITSQVRILLQRREDVLSVPLEAVSRADGKNYLTVASEQGASEKRQVELGIRTENAVEVISGLRAGERIVKSPVTKIGTKPGPAS